MDAFCFPWLSDWPANIASLCIVRLESMVATRLRSTLFGNYQASLEKKKSFSLSLLFFLFPFISFFFPPRPPSSIFLAHSQGAISFLITRRCLLQNERAHTLIPRHPHTPLSQALPGCQGRSSGFWRGGPQKWRPLLRAGFTYIHLEPAPEPRPKTSYIVNGGCPVTS